MFCFIYIFFAARSILDSPFSRELALSQTRLADRNQKKYLKAEDFQRHVMPKKIM